MNEITKILVGLDCDGDKGLTEGSRVATRQALWLATRTGARVEFLHSSYKNIEDTNQVHPASGETMRRQLEVLLAESGIQDSVLTIVAERPEVALIQRALAGEADLIVVAKRNHSRRDDRKLGSISMKLIRKCPVPVWVVRPDHPTRHQCVLAATDLTPVGDLATNYAAYLAKEDECKLCVVHAWQVPLDLQMSATRIGAEETARSKEMISASALQHIKALPAVAALGAKGEVFLACDSPSHAIEALVAKVNPDLVVMGTVSRGGLAGLLVGNTAEKLLYQLDASLLTVKPKDFICPYERLESLAVETIPLRGVSVG